MDDGLLPEESWAVIAQFFSFLTVILETLTGVVLFFIWLVLMGWTTLEPLFMVFQWMLLGVLIAAFFLTFLIVFTPLSEFLSTIRKTLVTGFLALLTLTAVIIVSITPQYESTLGTLYILPTVICILSVFIGYTGEFFVRKEALVTILDAEENAEDGIKRLLSRKRVLPEKIYYSVLIGLGVWGISIGVKDRLKGGGIVAYISQHLPTVTFLVLVGFLIGLGFASFFLIKKQLPKIR